MDDALHSRTMTTSLICCDN